ncbi:hypothetical protein AB4Z45_17550 [Paenibacillus sp. MCAF9]
MKRIMRISPIRLDRIGMRRTGRAMFGAIKMIEEEQQNEQRYEFIAG